MNLAIILKFLRDARIAFPLVALAVVGYVILFVWAIQSMGPQLMEFISQVGFLKKMLEFAFGIELAGNVSTNTLYAVAFTHPVVLALSWGFIIAAASKYTISEIEQGTADLLLTLPVTRVSVFVSGTLVWATLACLISFCPILGVWIGSHLFTATEPILYTNFIAPSFNFLAINLTVGAITTMVSCLVARRTQVIAIVLGVAIFSLTLNFLEPFLSWVKTIKFLGLLSYYRPADAVRNASWPVIHMISLAGIAIVTWTIGLIVYCRKDVPAP